jgi:hypothetical protein
MPEESVMTTPVVTELPRSLEPTTTDVFIDGQPLRLVLTTPGGTPMTDALTPPATGAMDAISR